jgi:hypothetical protein
MHLDTYTPHTLQGKESPLSLWRPFQTVKQEEEEEKEEEEEEEEKDDEAIRMEKQAEAGAKVN